MLVELTFNPWIIIATAFVFYLPPYFLDMGISHCIRAQFAYLYITYMNFKCRAHILFWQINPLNYTWYIIELTCIVIVSMPVKLMLVDNIPGAHVSQIEGKSGDSQALVTQLQSQLDTMRQFHGQLQGQMEDSRRDGEGEVMHLRREVTETREQLDSALDKIKVRDCVLQCSYLTQEITEKGL